MKFIKITFYSLAVFTIVQCTITKSATTTASSPISDNEFSAAQKKWSDVKMENLTAGHVVYTTKCNTCHGLKTISDYNEAQWEKLIASMAPKAKLNAQETDDLTKYIYAKRETSSK